MWEGSPCSEQLKAQPFIVERWTFGTDRPIDEEDLNVCVGVLIRRTPEKLSAVLMMEAIQVNVSWVCVNVGCNAFFKNWFK